MIRKDLVQKKISKNPQQCEICLTPWKDNIIPCWIRYFMKIRYIVYFLYILGIFCNSLYIYNRTEINPNGHVGFIIWVCISTFSLFGLFSKYKILYEASIFWKIISSVVFWIFSLAKMADQYTSDNTIYQKNIWQEENYQMDSILIVDTLVWILYISIILKREINNTESLIPDINNEWNPMALV